MNHLLHISVKGRPKKAVVASTAKSSEDQIYIKLFQLRKITQIQLDAAKYYELLYFKTQTVRSTPNLSQISLTNTGGSGFNQSISLHESIILEQWHNLNDYLKLYSIDAQEIIYEVLIANKHWDKLIKIKSISQRELKYTKKALDIIAQFIANNYDKNQLFSLL